MPTVVMVEKWLNDRDEALIVFYERDPEALPERRNPARITNAR